ncbi:hypothetical protein GGR53DRAFT_502916 [Hypoxylon sp. FL1150]|nr:hypothetical protein GGR53DRAFT_502916 [Hypoxylon sp. FL1150]
MRASAFSGSERNTFALFFFFFGGAHTQALGTACVFRLSGTWERGRMKSRSGLLTNQQVGAVAFFSFSFSFFSLLETQACGKFNRVQYCVSEEKGTSAKKWSC